MNRQNPEKFWIMEEIGAHASLHLSNNTMQIVAEHWREEGSVSLHQMAGLLHVEILPTGIDRARNLLKQRRRKVAKSAVRKSTGSYQPARLRKEKRAVRRPESTLSIPLGSPKHRSAVAKIEAVIEDISGYNMPWPKGLSSKEQVIAELSAGRQLLNSSTVRRDYLKRFLLNLLKRIADKFLDHAIGIAAAAALTALAALFGGFLE